MQRKAIQIGLFGFGCVGQGLWDVLQRSPGFQAGIARICVKDRSKQRSVPSGLITFEAGDILFDPDISVIVELIDDAEAAYHIVTTALRQGKSVVTANKKMLAEHLAELRALQAETGGALLYEAASCASIPVIRNLEEYYDNDLLESIEGIINGSTNYILTAMQRDESSFENALEKAQQLGFAESNPQLDISGQDARNKLVLLLAHAFGLIVVPDEIPYFGINRIDALTRKFAREQGYQLKLLAEARRLEQGITACVWPAFVKPGHELFSVPDEFNGLVTQSCFADRQFFMGKGAGAYPTASAVLSDLSALTYDYRYEYKKLNQQHSYQYAGDPLFSVFVSHAGKKLPDLADFEALFSSYQGSDGAYLTGNIRWSVLQKAPWFQEEGFSIVRLPEPLQLGNCLEERHLVAVA